MCTTLLVGKNASNDRSTMIARTDDGFFDVKKLVVVPPEKQKRKYKSVISHLEIDLPDDPLSYTACPSVDPARGVWAATGINSANVGMTATETITSNPLVLSADPLVVYRKAESRKEKDLPGGIGEEDMVVLTLPYIRSAREGVLRLAALLEKYGTYESNGIAFNDENEVWWMETIGGHHYIAVRVPDDVCVVAPNQFGLDHFDLDDALGEGKNCLCSPDLRAFIADNHLDCNQNGAFNPRDVFGSHYDSDHVYNTPRAWFMGRFLCPKSHVWDGENAEYKPEDDHLPWCLKPDRKVTVEDVKYLLSAHYQGTPYDPYTARDTGKRGIYRSIGINRTGVTSICQIRPDAPEPVKGVEWIVFGSTTFSAALPVYPQVRKMPRYLSEVSLEVSSENFYWSSRLIDALADHNFGTTVQIIERYHRKMFTEARKILLEYDEKIAASGDVTIAEEANEKLAALAKKETAEALGRVLHDAGLHMKNGYNRADN
ncbi:MAG: C69 family dipeptidase [Clostridia bacterium]|nr:C69 family dipeptidase [Clostridia bacterium]